MWSRVLAAPHKWRECRELLNVRALGCSHLPCRLAFSCVARTHPRTPAYYHTGEREEEGEDGDAGNGYWTKWA